MKSKAYASGICAKLGEFEDEFEKAYGKMQEMIEAKQSVEQFRIHMTTCVDVKNRYKEFQNVARSLVATTTPKAKTKCAQPTSGLTAV